MRFVMRVVCEVGLRLRPIGRGAPLCAFVAAVLLAGCALPPADDGRDAASPGAAAAPLPAPALADVPDEPESEWRPLKLPGKRETRYRFGQKDGRWAVEALADSSASMLRRTLDVAPDRLADVSWSWWVESTLPQADLATAGRTDAPVRVMFAFDGDRSRLSARARLMADLARALTGEEPPYATLVYTWGSHEPPETLLTNPRTDRVRKIIVDSGNTQLRRWRHHRRNLAADYRRAFGEAPGRLVGVALMTDGDNTQTRVRAWYGRITLHGPAPAARQSSADGTDSSPNS